MIATLRMALHGNPTTSKFTANMVDYTARITWRLCMNPRPTRTNLRRWFQGEYHEHRRGSLMHGRTPLHMGDTKVPFTRAVLGQWRHRSNRCISTLDEIYGIMPQCIHLANVVGVRSWYREQREDGFVSEISLFGVAGMTYAQ